MAWLELRWWEVHVEQPPAEFEIDEAMVRGLLTDQHPDLAHLPLQRIDAGWDNELWRLGEALIVRMPRRLAAVALTLNEQRWLPVIAEELPLPVPTLVRVGRPGGRFPWPWSVVPFLPGEPGDRSPLSVSGDASRRLAAFLRALHVPAPADAPFNAFRGSASLLSRAETFERLVAALGGEVDPGGLCAVWDAGVTAQGPDGPARLAPRGPASREHTGRAWQPRSRHRLWRHVCGRSRE